jgi:formylglycine-generating enzyme required for sulfatase activity
MQCDRPWHRSYWRGPLGVAVCLLQAACQSGPHAGAAPADRVIRELVMVPIPGGSFLMGDVTHDGERDELPVRRVTLNAFRLSRFETTVGEFRAFADATGYRSDAERNANGRQGCVTLEAGVAGPGYRPGASWREPGFPQSDRHPVVCVSFADAQAFISWLNEATHRRFRLPTESEWERAARAGTQTTYPWGADPGAACAYANGADETPGPAGQRWPQRLPCADGYFNTAPVGSFRANRFGLHDMIGNAWEWVADCYRDSLDGAPSDGSAVLFEGCSRRAVRGGAWPYPAQWLRSANRGGSNAELRANDRGFRLAE